MSNPSEHEPDTITIWEMCVVERRPDGSLRTSYHPIAYDSKVRDRLNSLGRDMKAWEDDLCKRLAGHVGPLLAEVLGAQGADAISIANHFCHAARDVYRWLGLEAEADDCRPVRTREFWRDLYGAGIHRLPEYSKVIKGSHVTREAVEARRPLLDEVTYRELASAHRIAEGMRPHLQAALDEYERRFCDFVEEAERVCPGITYRKSFCRDFAEAYGKAELDFDISPGNQCVVESIDHYYWAWVLERLYGAYEGSNSIVAYSHRRLGWRGSDQTIMLAPRSDLRLVTRTNFGFGRDRYFGSVLSYGGVSAINASLVMFFQGVDKVGVFDFTYCYEVEEASFAGCFRDAVRLHSEYRRMGKERFVERYFLKPLQDLSDLLSIVANTDTFLKITTLRRFDALTSGRRNALIPDEGFSSVSLALSADEERVADQVVMRVLSVISAYGTDACVGDPRVKSLLDKVFSPHESNELQLIVKRELVRNRVIKGLKASLKGSSSIGDLVNALVPQDEGVLVESYEGYALVSMRVDKALSAMEAARQLSGSSRVAELTGFASAVDSIKSTCSQIGDQAQDYVSREIGPALARKASEREQLRSHLSKVKAEMDRAGRHGGNLAWLKSQSRTLSAQLLETSDEISELKTQRNKLDKYIRAVGRFQPQK